MRKMAHSVIYLRTIDNMIRGFFEMKQRLIRFSRYMITFLLLVAFCVGLLFACGLAPQDRVEANYLLSLDEIEPEWSNTNVLRQKWGSYALDDWTEVIILSLSTYMDVRSAPDSVLKNSYPLEDDFTFADARNTVKNHEKADVFYPRYWHGFRTYVRALLSVMDYGTMRTLIMWTFFLLRGLCTLMLGFQTRSAWPPMLFIAAGVAVFAGGYMLFSRTGKHSYMRALVMLAISFFPILWTLVATEPMYKCMHFQYRILAVTMLGGFYFWLMSVKRERLPDLRISEGEKTE
jgi:hypothetical protein